MDFEDIKWWVEDNWKALVGVLSIFAVIGLTLYIFRVEAGRAGKLPDSYEEKIETLQTGSVEIKESFSLLDEMEISTVEGQSVYEISLYNKKPFIETRDMEMLLDKYVKSLEIVEETYDRELRAVKFILYDRKIKYDLGVRPDGVYYYGIPYQSLPQEEKDDENSRYYSMSPQEVAYDYTSLYAPEKIDKSLYSLYGNYRQLRRVPGVEPLSDQEYNWYVKLDAYTTLGEDTGSLYLEWELGAPKNSTAARLFRQDVREFRKRLSTLGEETSLYEVDSISVEDLKRDLVIENPSFLWYVESGQVEENAIQARALLVEEYPDKYQKVVEDWVRSLAEDQIRQMQQGTDPATSGDYSGDSMGGLGEEDARTIGNSNKVDLDGNIHDEVEDLTEE